MTTGGHSETTEVAREALEEQWLLEDLELLDLEALRLFGSVH